MLRSSTFRVLVVLVPLALVVSACGVSMSGEPNIVNEREIPAVPTETPAAVAPSGAEAAAPTAASGAEAGAPAAAEPTQALGDTTPAPAGSIDLASADFDQGFELYLSECAQCHGAQAGVGPSLADMNDRAVSGANGLSGADYIYQSIVDPAAVVADGYENIMPTDYATRLSQDQIANLVKFITDFSPEAMMAGPGGSTAGQAETPAAPEPSAGSATPAAGAAGSPAASPTPAETLTVRGKLIQGTADGETIPAGLPMELYALDMHGNLTGSYETETADDGSYVFENVARGPSSAYYVYVHYADVTQGAQIDPIQGDEEELTKDVTVYERTTDTSNVTITWAQMLVNYAPIDQFGLEIWLRVDLANTGDRIVTTDETAGPNDWYVSATLELPVQAFGIQPMQSEGSNRFDVQVVDGVPTVKDTWPLRPGQVQTITLAYYLPYNNGAVLDQAFSYPVMDATVLVPNDTVELRSDQLDAGEWRYRVTSDGTQLTELQVSEDINPDKDFSLIKAHNLTAPLAANERLKFELVGKPTRTLDAMGASAQNADDNTNYLPLALGAAGVLVLGLAGVLFWRQQRTAPAPADAAGAPTPVVVRDSWREPGPHATKEELLGAIAALDAAHEAGEMDDDTYEERRQDLVDRLVPLMDDEG